MTKASVSQLVTAGIPVDDDGRINAVNGCAWVLANLTDIRARHTRAAARSLMAESMAWNTVQAVVMRVPKAVALAAPRVGLRREQAEPLANFSTLFLAARA